MKYITDTKLQTISERLSDKQVQKAESIASKFSVNKEDDHTCGNVRVVFNDGKASFTSDYKESDTHSYQQISSALALYRTISLFKCGVDHTRVDHYKLNWYISLKHCDTGEVLGLGEWKGGFQIFTSARNVKELSKEFKKDAEKLLTILVSMECPIGYDNVIAGTVA